MCGDEKAIYIYVCVINSKPVLNIIVVLIFA